MTRLFGFTADEALGRINRQWAGLDFAPGWRDLRYHEDATFWAKTIVYGKDSYWWLDPPGLTPKPYP